MTRDKAIETVRGVGSLVGFLATIGLLGALIAIGVARERVDVNEARLDSLEPRQNAIEREVSGIAAKQEAMHEDIREIKRFILDK